MKRSNIESLLRCLTSGDKDGVITALRQAAALESNAGKEAWAISLEGWASKLERKAPYEPKILSMLSPSGKTAPSLAAFQERVPTRGLEEIILHRETQKEVEDLLQEHECRELLETHQLSPRNRILLIGPPGSGKTLLAEILAKETKKPFYILQMGALMDSLLGNTIRNIENSFAAIALADGVFLFDEFDALSTARETKSDVNEMRRALNALLQCFENHIGRSIVVAATNHPQSIDIAFRRRFDAIWKTQDPTDQCRKEIIERTCNKHKLPQTQAITDTLAETLKGFSYDECEDITKKLIAKAVMAKQTEIDPTQTEHGRKIIGHG